MSQAAEAYTSNVVPFRRAANDQSLNGRAAIRGAWEEAKAAQEPPAPSQADVAALIIAAIALSLPEEAAEKVRRRLNTAYLAAKDPVRKETARLAAEAMGVVA